LSFATALTVGLAVLIAPPANAAAPDGRPVLSDSTVANETGDVTLAWDAVDGAGSYKVEISTASDFSTLLDSTTTTGLRWVPTKELGGTEERRLYWRVTALGSSTTDFVTDNVSLSGQFERGPAPVPSPESPTATVDYPDAVVFAWAPVPGAVSYTLQYGQDSSFATTTTKTTVGTAFTPQTSEFTPGISYYWRVRAVFASAAGGTTAGGYTVPTTFGVSWLQSAPTNLVPASTSSADGSKLATYSDLDLSWDPVPGAKSYVVQVATAPGFATTDLVTVAGASAVLGNSLAVETQLPNGTYYWRVTAVDAAGRSGKPSAVSSFRRSFGAQQAPEVTDLDIVRATDVTSTYPAPVGMSSDRTAPTTLPSDAIQLSWSPVPRATGYQVQVAAADTNFDTATSSTMMTCYTPYTSVTPIVAVSPALPSIKNSAPCLATAATFLTAGTTYKWRVRAIDLPGTTTSPTFQSAPTTSTLTSQWSDPLVTGVPQQKAYFVVGAPAAGSTDPAALQAPEYDASVSEAPLMTWQPVATTIVDEKSGPLSVKGYKVDVSRDASFTSFMSYWTPEPMLRLNGSLGNDVTNDAYYWRVYACTSASQAALCGSEANSSRFKRSTSTPVAAAPKTSDAGTVRLSWTPASVTAPYDGGTRGYEVSIATDADFNSVVSTIKTDTPFAELAATGRGLTNGQKYYYRVRALGPSGEALGWSNVVDFTKSGPDTTLVDTPTRADRVVLTWSPVFGAQSYKVSYTTGSTTLTVASRQSTSLAIDALAPGAYSWSVKGTDAFGIEQPTNAQGAFTVSGSDLRLSAPDVVTPTSRTLAWSVPTGTPAPASYKVDFSLVQNFSTILKSATTVATSYTPVVSDSLAAGTYYWRVTPYTSNGKALVTTTAGTPLTVRTAPVLSASATPTLTVAGSQLSVAWTKLTGTSATGGADAPVYVLRYRETGASDWAELPPTAADAQGFTVSGLREGTSYDVQYLAQNSLGTSIWSAVKTARTQTVPGAPTKLLASVLKSTTMTLTWTAPGTSDATAATGYDVTYGVPGDVMQTLSTTSTTAALAGLAPGTTYAVSVQAKNATGSGGTVAGLFTTTSSPTTPLGVSAKAGDRQVILSWSAPSDPGSSPVTGYLVQQSTFTASTGTWSAWSTRVSSVAGLTTTFTGLTNGTAYRYQVQATNAVGGGRFSESVSVTPVGLAAAATGLKVVVKDRSVDLSWSAPTDTGGSPVTRYSIEQSAYSATTKTWGSWRAVASTATLAATIGGLSNGTTYQYRVQTTTAVGAGAYSSVVSATPVGLPSAPGSLKATRGDKSVKLTWAAPTSTGGLPLAGYTVQYRSYSSGSKAWTSWKSSVSTSAATRAAVVPSLVNGTTYELRVMARNSLGSGAASASSKAVPAGKPSVPTSVKATPGTGKIKVSWKAPSSNGSAITGYVVQYSTNGTAWKTLQSVSKSSTSYTWTKATKKKTYYFRVYAKNGVGSGTPSAKVKAVRTK